MARQLTQWKQKVRENWQNVSITFGCSDNILQDVSAISGENVALEAVVFLGNLQPEDVSVELYYGTIDNYGNVESGEFVPMQIVDQINPGTYRYRVNLTLTSGGELGYNLRVIPDNCDLSDKFELRLVKWMDTMY